MYHLTRRGGSSFFDGDFDFLQEGFNVVQTGAPAFGAEAVRAGAGRNSIDRNVTGPRSAFLSYRRGRQLGARVKLDF